ncbi:hypothetical protein HAX54_000252, partial [Datura stramonium]|nr:hypothetical protein [Datura stramonium]
MGEGHGWMEDEDEEEGGGYLSGCAGWRDGSQLAFSPSKLVAGDRRRCVRGDGGLEVRSSWAFGARKSVVF